MAMKWICLIGGVVIAVTYSAVLILLRRRVQTETPFTSWLTTLFSVVVAALVGMFVFFFQNDLADAQDKKQHLTLIRSELQSNLNDLRKPDKNRMTIIRGDTTSTVLFIDLQDFCMVAAIQSRLFDGVETTNLYTIVNGFHKHRQYEEYLKAMIQEPSTHPSNIKQAADNLNELDKEIIARIGQLQQTLNIRQ